MQIIRDNFHDGPKQVYQRWQNRGAKISCRTPEANQCFWLHYKGRKELIEKTFTANYITGL